MTHEVSTRRTVLEWSSSAGPAMATTDTDLIIAWADLTAGGLRLARGDGSVFGSSIAVDGTSGQCPAIHADRSGDVQLAWIDLRDGRIHVARARNGAAFDEHYVLKHRSGHGPSLCAFRRYHLLAWTSENGLVHVASGDGVSWREPVVVEGPAASSAPALAAVANTLHILWRDAERTLVRSASADGVHFARHRSVDSHPSSAPCAYGHRGMMAAAWLEDNSIVVDLAIDRNDPSSRITLPYPAVGTPAIAAVRGELVLGWTAADTTRALTVNVLERPDGDLQSTFLFRGDTGRYDPFHP